MLSDEFPHSVEVKRKTSVPDGTGGYTTGWATVFSMMGFLDTPTSRERYEAQQMKNPLDRYLYFPYRTDITPAMRLTCEGETYEFAGRAEDQGGQHEIMRVALKLAAP